MLAILIVLREVFKFAIEFIKPNGNYSPGTKRLWLLGVSVSYILTIIFTGLKLL